MKLSPADQAIVDQALSIMESALNKAESLDRYPGPKDMAQYLRVKFAPVTHEIFSVYYLDAEMRLLGSLDCSQGTTEMCDIHCGPIVKRALELGAWGVVACHNHPAGRSCPSVPDIKATEALRIALGVFELRFLDHLVIGGQDGSVFSILAKDWVVPERRFEPIPFDVSLALHNPPQDIFRKERP